MKSPLRLKQNRSEAPRIFTHQPSKHVAGPRGRACRNAPAPKGRLKLKSRLWQLTELVGASCSVCFACFLFSLKDHGRLLGAVWGLRVGWPKPHPSTQAQGRDDEIIALQACPPVLVQSDAYGLGFRESCEARPREAMKRNPGMTLQGRHLGPCVMSLQQLHSFYPAGAGSGGALRQKLGIP